MRMLFEWDEAKRRRNVEKHGIDFLLAADSFDGRPAYTYASPRAEEERFVTVALLAGRCCAVVWTRRGDDRVRIISARRARRDEEEAYEELHG